MSAISAKAARKPRVVIDTTVLVSGLLYGGKPEQVLDKAYDKEITAVISETLLEELKRVLFTKFKISAEYWSEIELQIRDSFELTEALIRLNVVKDEPDNRVLEAAVTGNCDYIVTGDKPLLALNEYQEIKIIGVSQFLELYPAKEQVISF